MFDAPQSASGSLTIRDLRRDRSLQPGGEQFALLIQRFLPLTQGIAVALIPESPEAADTVSMAVFEAFATRWRRAARKTFVATWLVRTARFAAIRERSRLGLPARATTPDGRRLQTLFKALTSLKPHLATPIILRHLLDQEPGQIAAAFWKKQARTDKWMRTGLAKLASPVHKAARKNGLAIVQPSELLGSIPALFTEERLGTLTFLILESISSPQRSELARATLKDWSWFVFFAVLKRLGKGIARAAAVLLVVVLTVVFLFRQGYLMPWLIMAGKGRIAAEFPGITEPARPWPVTEADRALASMRFPETANDLYGITNIWLATIRLTAKQWRDIQPHHIQAVQPMRQQDGKLILRNPKATRSGLAGVVGLDFPWSEGSLEFAGKEFARVGVRYRGNGTFLNSKFGNKQSLKVDLNRNVKKQSIAGVNTLNFVNSIPDFSYMKDALAEQLFRELGAVNPRTSYAYLTLDVPGKFTNQAIGLYVLIEDIGSDFAKDRFGSKETPIFKPVTYDLFADLGNDWKNYEEIYDLKTKATPQQLARVVEFARLVSTANDEVFARRLPEFLDLEEYAAFVAGHTLLSSYDGYFSNGQNFYMYLDPRSNKFGFIPWDQDHAWGEFGYVGKAAQRENASIWRPETYDNKFLRRVMNVEAFKQAYRRKLEEGLAGPFTVERLNQQIDAMAPVIRPAIAAENAFRLGRFDISISTNWISGPRDGNPNDEAGEGPKAPPHQLKRFIQARAKSVRDQLDGKEKGDRLSGF